MMIAGISDLWTKLSADVSIPTYLLVVLGLFALVGFAISAMLLWIWLSADEYDDHTSGKMEHLGLRWRWHLDPTSGFVLHSYCIDCDYQIDPRPVEDPEGGSGRTEFFCEDCSRVVQTIDQPQSDIEARVNHKIEQETRGHFNI